jgi:hypothetical protein
MSQPGSRRQATIVPHPAGRRGVLTTAHGQALPVQTYQRGGEEVVLVVLTDAEAPPSGVDPATLEYTTVRGIVRLRGDAVFEPRSIIRFVTAGDAQVIQRRAFVRVHTPQEVMLVPEETGTPRRVYSVDLSGGGMLLSNAPGLRTGDTVEFAISIGDETELIEGAARVVRVEDDGRRALAFEQIDESDRDRLIRFVFSRLRDSRAKTRGDLT